jgi:hypothetical protein
VSWASVAVRPTRRSSTRSRNGIMTLLPHFVHSLATCVNPSAIILATAYSGRRKLSMTRCASGEGSRTLGR